MGFCDGGVGLVVWVVFMYWIFVSLVFVFFFGCYEFLIKYVVCENVVLLVLFFVNVCSVSVWLILMVVWSMCLEVLLVIMYVELLSWV